MDGFDDRTQEHAEASTMKRSKEISEITCSQPLPERSCFECLKRLVFIRTLHSSPIAEPSFLIPQSRLWPTASTQRCLYPISRLSRKYVRLCATNFFLTLTDPSRARVPSLPFLRSLFSIPTCDCATSALPIGLQCRDTNPLSYPLEPDNGSINIRICRGREYRRICAFRGNGRLVSHSCPLMQSGTLVDRLGGVQDPRVLRTLRSMTIFLPTILHTSTANSAT